LNYRRITSDQSFWIRSLSIVLLLVSTASCLAQTRFAQSGSRSPYIHWIDLYDATGRKIDPDDENAKPYSPEKTCGRCHEADTISHGWHFNAVEPTATAGRPGQPWIWIDERTGTALPLSYREWKNYRNPDDLGLSRWQVAEHLGGYLPGGGPGSAESFEADPTKELEEKPPGYLDRSHVTGPLLVDCMMCHHADGSGYSPMTWTEQVEEQNFAYAPTAAAGIATISGNMERLKDDFDASESENADKLPQVSYETGQFRGDGKIFFDLKRTPSNSACYYCHTNIEADSAGGNRWLHEEDVHIQSGIACADCHRNGLDHHTIRGFPGENHPSGRDLVSFSCEGCHIPDKSAAPMQRSGRLGSPIPQHKGLPPLHFEKMTCTACHSGTLVENEVPRQLNSLIHYLGKHIRRDEAQLPGIVGPVTMRTDEEWRSFGEDGFDSEHAKYTPHRMMWPSYWGLLKDSQVTAIHPEVVYEIVRRPLKVNRDFVDELQRVRLSSSDLRELLGAERVRTRPEDRTPEEQEKVRQAELEIIQEQVTTRMSAALQALEEEYSNSQAVFITAGVGYTLNDHQDGLKTVSDEDLGGAAAPASWPMGHNVRPAQQALGANGCTDCHSAESAFFHATVTPVNMIPEQPTESIPILKYQGSDPEMLSIWDQLFEGRSLFKVFGIAAIVLTIVILLIAAGVQIAAARLKAK